MLNKSLFSKDIFFISQNKHLKSMIAYRLCDLICVRIGEHTELINRGMQSFIGMFYCGKPLREPIPSKVSCEAVCPAAFRNGLQNWYSGSWLRGACSENIGLSSFWVSMSITSFATTLWGAPILFYLVPPPNNLLENLGK